MLKSIMIGRMNEYFCMFRGEYCLYGGSGWWFNIFPCSRANIACTVGQVAGLIYFRVQGRIVCTVGQVAGLIYYRVHGRILPVRWVRLLV